MTLFDELLLNIRGDCRKLGIVGWKLEDYYYFIATQTFFQVTSFIIPNSALLTAPGAHI
jgi:hypothetical protein